MAKKLAGDKKTTIGEVSQTIDIKKYLGDKPTSEQKSLFAELAIDVMENRTLDGDDINGKQFKKYSKAYAELKGVTVDSVDLFLEGDMLDGIGRRKSKERVNTIFMQMKKGLQTKKSFNHDTGDTTKKREFFGITDREAKEIAKEVKKVKKKQAVSISDLQAALNLLDIEQL